MTTFGKCKANGTAKFPGEPCYQPNTDPPLYLGLGYVCGKTGDTCSNKTCPLRTRPEAKP